MTRPAPYRKLPISIEAMQWRPDDPETTGYLIGWLTANGATHRCGWDSGGHTTLVLRTLEGDMTARPGDWIIRGVRGEFYPCAEDIFNETYEAT